MNEFKKLMKEAEKTRNDPLYQLEHHVFRTLFFQHPEKTIKSLKSDPNFFYSVYQTNCGLIRQRQKYKEDDFIVELYKNATNEVFKITCPKPQRQTIAFKIYLVFTENTPLHYYTIERGESENVAIKCEWDSEGNHMNYGQVKLEDDYGLIDADVIVRQDQQETEINENTAEENNYDNVNSSLTGVSKEETIEEGKKICKSCGKELPLDSRFCQYCGSDDVVTVIPKKVLVCPVCKKELQEDSVFCQYCGNKIKTVQSNTPPLNKDDTRKYLKNIDLNSDSKALSNSKKPSKLLVVLLTFATVLLLVLISFSYMKRQNIKNESPDFYIGNIFADKFISEPGRDFAVYSRHNTSNSCIGFVDYEVEYLMNKGKTEKKTKFKINSGIGIIVVEENVTNKKFYVFIY